MKQSSTFRFIVFLLIYCLSAGMVFSQNTFQRTFGKPTSNDEAFYIIPISDGYMLAGNGRGTGTGSWDASLIKIDHDANILWQKTYGYVGGGLDDFFHVAETSEGGFLAVGAASGFENGATDFIIVKTDADGNPLWQKRVSGSSSNFSEWGNYVLPVSDGYIISGSAMTKTGFSTYFRGLLYRIDHNGDVIWSRMYSSGASHTQYLSARYISGDTLFACGQRDSAGIFARFNAATGNLIAMQSFDGADFGNDAFRSIVQASNGDFLLAGHVEDTSGLRQWVCRVSRTGELKWSKIYSGTGFVIGQGGITALSDDHFLLATTMFFSGINTYDPVLVKIDGNGEVVWSEKYGKSNTDIFHAGLEAPDGGIIAVGSTKPLGSNSISPVTLVVKTDENGRVPGCCRQLVQITAMPYQVESFPSDFTQTTFFDPQDFSLITEANTLTPLDFCPPGPPEQVSREVFICPGDSVLIDGISYFAPGTVTSTIPGLPCDSLVTYTIQYADTDGASVVNIQCPTNKVVQVPTGANSAVVDFDLPVAQSDCVCPGVEIEQTQGLPSGSNFSIGVHSICYQGQDSCGNSSACCFQISVVEDEDACDLKTNGCVTFELLRITRNADWQRTYHIRVTNNCAQPLVYAAFQIPDGVVADAPANNDLYTAPSGRQYLVRNPNYSPFYSVRFSSQNAGIQGGASDIFEYTLPPQSAPSYIQAMVKTATQTYTAAHLNTFNCPVEFDPTSQKPSGERDADVADDDMVLFPNPTTSVLFVNFKTSLASTHIRVFSAQGNLVFEKRAEMQEQTLRVDLPKDMASGLYLFEAMGSDGQRRVKRFVVR